MRAFVAVLLYVLVGSATAQVILQPANTNGQHVALVLVGRKDVSLNAYKGVSASIQSALLPDVSLWVAIAQDYSNMTNLIASLRAGYSITDFFFAGHSMTDGGVLTQQWVAANPDQARGVVLLASFLQRSYRSDVAKCLPEAEIKITYNRTYPLGYLADGVHDCYGPNILDSYKIPTLTVGGELDGVVRVARHAEAYYTQNVLTNQAANYPVVVVSGLNHASLLDYTSLSDLPATVVSNDLRAELSTADARSAVAQAVAAFARFQLKLSDSSAISSLVQKSAPLLQPLISAFVDKEGSWYFTGNDDEHGSSSWAAAAQQWMIDPMPVPYTWASLTNQFRLLSDEEGIPPYYRDQHRASVNVSGPQTFLANTICQLRFVNVTVEQSELGLNASAIIEEEKLNVLTALPDDGSVYVSALEIATKMRSRQFAYNETGYDAPDSLDDPPRCAPINQKAVDWAIQTVLPATASRFNTYGLPFVMGPDQLPEVTGGPWFIWTYLNYTYLPDSVIISSVYQFASLSAADYGSGTHYCKLLSPARAMEWMYTDGLRAKYGLSTALEFD